LVKVIVNDNEFYIEKKTNLYDFLKEKGYIKEESKWVVIVVNGEPKSIEEIKNLNIENNLKIELANIVGGG